MDTLTITLLTISAIGLVMALLSIMGLDLGAADFELGDSGIGLLTLLTPGITLGTGVAGMMLTLDVAGPLISLSVGAGALVLGVLTLYPLLRVLLRGGQPAQTTDLAGHPVTIVDAPDWHRVGTAEAITANGSQVLTVLLDPQYHGHPLRPGQSGYVTHTADSESLTWYVTAFA